MRRLSQRAWRVEVWASWCLLCFLIGFLAIVRAKAQDTERRLNALESIGTEHRLTAIEARLSTIENIGYGVLIIVGAQLAIGGLNLRSRRDVR